MVMFGLIVALYSYMCCSMVHGDNSMDGVECQSLELSHYHDHNTFFGIVHSCWASLDRRLYWYEVARYGCAKTFYALLPSVYFLKSSLLRSACMIPTSYHWYEVARYRCAKTFDALLPSVSFLKSSSACMIPTSYQIGYVKSILLASSIILEKHLIFKDRLPQFEASNYIHSFRCHLYAVQQTLHFPCSILSYFSSKYSPSLTIRVYM